MYHCHKYKIPPNRPNSCPLYSNLHLSDNFYNPILDGVWTHPILRGGGQKSSPQVNSAIWCLTTMKPGRCMIKIFWGGGRGCDTFKPPTPTNNFCLHPLPVLGRFWKDPLMTPQPHHPTSSIFHCYPLQAKLLSSLFQFTFV